MKLFGSKKVDAAARVKTIHRTSTLHLIANDPFLDWMLILITAFTLSLTLVVIGASVYLETGATLAAPAPVNSRSAMARVDTKALNAILDEFDARAKERSVPAGEYRAPKDPSLP